jgi:hypothetical protein
VKPWYDEQIFAGLTIGQVWTFLGPLVAGLVAAIAVDFFSKRRERDKVRREWLAQRLEMAFHLLTEASEVPGMPMEQAYPRKLKLQSAINTIDLYGDNETKRIAKEILLDYTNGKEWVEYGSLQTALRDRFRENLGLEKLNDPVMIVVFGDHSTINNDN